MGTLRAPVRTRDAQSTQRKLLALWPAILLGTASGARALADDASSRLDELMAGYVFNFTKFVEWPESSHAEALVICVAGNSGLFNALSSAAGNTYPRSVHVRELEDAHSAAGCHVMYIESASEMHISDAEHVLTVSDGNGFAHSGGTIELFTQQKRLRFRINLESARHAGLHISSNLLQLAASIEGEQPK